MITDEQIEAAFKGTNFGSIAETIKSKRIFLAETIFKRLAEYAAGGTITIILQELGFTKTLGGHPIKAAIRWAYDEYKPAVGCYRANINLTVAHNAGEGS